MFISYDYIFDNFKEWDGFYDRKLQRFEFIGKKDSGLVKELHLVDQDGNDFFVYNYTKASRILISMGIFKRLKKWILWDKQILLTEEFADILMDDGNEKIISEYKDMLQYGLDNGLITKNEYNELINNFL